MVVELAAEVVADTDLNVWHLVQDVKLGQGHGGGAIDPDGVARDSTVEPAHPARPAGDRAELVAALANGVAHVVRELGRKGSVADTRGVALANHNGFVDARRRDAGTCAGAARSAIGAGDVRVRAEVQVEHGGLGAFKENVGAPVERVVDDRKGVADIGIQRPSVPEVLLDHVVVVKRLFRVEALKGRVLDLANDEIELLAHEDLLLEVADPKADSPDLVGVCGTDAAPGGAQPVVAARLLFELVEEGVIAHDQVGALADDQVAWLDAALSELLDLADEDARVGDHAVADDAGDVRMQDAARDELELELAMLGDDGMPSVVAALGSDHHVGLLGEEVDELALALVSPLSTDDNYDHSGDSPTVDSGGWVGLLGGPDLEGKGAASLARPEAGSALATTRGGESGRVPPTICPPTTTRTTAVALRRWTVAGGWANQEGPTSRERGQRRLPGRRPGRLCRPRGGGKPAGFHPPFVHRRPLGPRQAIKPRSGHAGTLLHH